MGGHSAVAFALFNPGRVGKLVLMGGGTGGPSQFVPMPTEGIKLLQGLYRDPTIENLKKMMAVFVFDTSSLTEALYQARLDNMMSRKDHLRTSSRASPPTRSSSPTTARAWGDHRADPGHLGPRRPLRADGRGPAPAVGHAQRRAAHLQPLRPLGPVGSTPTSSTGWCWISWELSEALAPGPGTPPRARLAFGGLGRGALVCCGSLVGIGFSVFALLAGSRFHGRFAPSRLRRREVVLRNLRPAGGPSGRGNITAWPVVRRSGDPTSGKEKGVPTVTPNKEIRGPHHLANSPARNHSPVPIIRHGNFRTHHPGQR